MNSSQLLDSHMTGCDFVSFVSTDTEPLYTEYCCIRAHSTTRSSLGHVMSFAGVRPKVALYLIPDSTAVICVGLCLSLSWSRLVLTRESYWLKSEKRIYRVLRFFL